MSNNNLQIKDKVAQEKRHWIRLTRVCNNNCLFCLDKENQNGKIIPVGEVMKKLEQGRREKASRAILSGGEPTLHPQIIKIIKEAKKLGYSHTQLISNGRLLASEKFVKKLKEAGLDEITLSLHSHRKKDFEATTGIKGSYLQAMQGLVNALKHNFIVSVDIVINKINYKTLKNTLIFFTKLGVTEFDLLQVTPFGGAWLNKEKVFYSASKAKKYLNEAFELSKNKDLFIWTNRLPAIHLEGYENLIQQPIKLKDEIKERRREFENYLAADIPLPCFGKRCRYCFIAGFCQDLTALKKFKILKSKSGPFCLATNNGLNQKKKIWQFQKKLNWDNFLNFYIKNRYFVKSLRCKKCRYDNRCDGAWIQDIRKKGFKILRPVKKQNATKTKIIWLK